MHSAAKAHTAGVDSLTEIGFERSKWSTKTRIALVVFLLTKTPDTHLFNQSAKMSNKSLKMSCLGGNNMSLAPAAFGGGVRSTAFQVPGEGPICSSRIKTDLTRMLGKKVSSRTT